MRKLKKVIMGISVATLVLSGCGKISKNRTEDLWKSAQQEESIRVYCNNNQALQEDEEMITELANTAADESNEMKQRYHAMVLLSEIEYLKGVKAQTNEDLDQAEMGVFQVEYNKASEISEVFMKQLLADPAVFADLIDVSSDYNAFSLLLATIDGISEDTFRNLIEILNDTDSHKKDRLVKGMNEYLVNNPDLLVNYSDIILASGYFNNQDFNSGFYSVVQGAASNCSNLSVSLGYIEFLKNKVLPVWETDYAEYSTKWRNSDTDEQDTAVSFHTKFDFSLSDDLSLSEVREITNREPVILEGKKILVVYKNPQAEEYQGSAPKQRILGDAMLALDDQQRPLSSDEIDCIVLLTAHYMNGGKYSSYSGSEIDIEMVYSFTSVDLYDGHNGEYLRHFGVFKESPSQRIMYQQGDTGRYEFPDPVSSYKILQKVNEALEKEAETGTITEPVEVELHENTMLEIGQPVILEDWEVTVNAYELVDSISDNYLLFTPQDAGQYLKAKVTITNKGNESLRLLPMIADTSKDLYFVVQNQQEELIQPVNLLSYREGLFSKTVEPGETISGFIPFEIPDDLIVNDDDLSLVVYLAPQSVCYPLQ